MKRRYSQSDREATNESQEKEGFGKKITNSNEFEESNFCTDLRWSMKIREDLSVEWYTTVLNGWKVFRGRVSVVGEKKSSYKSQGIFSKLNLYGELWGININSLRCVWIDLMN